MGMCNRLLHAVELQIDQCYGEGLAQASDAIVLVCIHPCHLIYPKPYYFRDPSPASRNSRRGADLAGVLPSCQTIVLMSSTIKSERLQRRPGGAPTLYCNMLIIPRLGDGRLDAKIACTHFQGWRLVILTARL